MTWSTVYSVYSVQYFSAVRTNRSIQESSKLVYFFECELQSIPDSLHLLLATLHSDHFQLDTHTLTLPDSTLKHIVLHIYVPSFCLCSSKIRFPWQKCSIEGFEHLEPYISNHSSLSPVCHHFISRDPIMRMCNKAFIQCFWDFFYLCTPFSSIIENLSVRCYIEYMSQRCSFFSLLITCCGH